MDFLSGITHNLNGSVGGLGQMAKSALSLDLSGVLDGLIKTLTGGGQDSGQDSGQLGPSAAGNSLMERELQQLLASMKETSQGDDAQDQDDDALSGLST
jgi:hypothetical protein